MRTGETGFFFVFKLLNEGVKTSYLNLLNIFCSKKYLISLKVLTHFYLKRFEAHRNDSVSVYTEQFNCAKVGGNWKFCRILFFEHKWSMYK